MEINNQNRLDKKNPCFKRRSKSESPEGSDYSFAKREEF